ncbi:MAG: helix-turn-helix domain-containing protein [Thermoleophilaceae bacterium]
MVSKHEFKPSISGEALKALAELLSGELRAMSDETEAAVLRELPVLDSGADATLRRHMIEATFRRMIVALSGEAEPESEAATHIAFGAASARAGIPLETLTAGYRIGARVGWAHLRRGVRALQLDPDLVLALADAHVAYVDELAANSVEGYAREADAVRGERARERQALLDRLLAGDAGQDEEGVRAAARAARWPWPERLAVAVLLAGNPRFAPDEQVLVGSAGRATVAAGPPAALEAWLARAEVSAALALSGAAQAPTALARARQLAGLAAAGVLAPVGTLRWEDELSKVVLNADPAASAALAERRLAPLRDRAPARTRLLEETLGAWLDNPGRPSAIAHALHLHPQTVRYRLARLRERLGDALDDPDARFEFCLALRYRAGRADQSVAVGIGLPSGRTAASGSR